MESTGERVKRESSFIKSIMPFKVTKVIDDYTFECEYVDSPNTSLKSKIITFLIPYRFLKEKVFS